jgi:hypothetical protein
MVEGILLVAASTFASPYFNPGGSNDTEFITFCKEAVLVLHMPAIMLAKVIHFGSFQLLAIVLGNVVWLTIVFLFVVAFARKVREIRNLASCGGLEAPWILRRHTISDWIGVSLWAFVVLAAFVMIVLPLVALVVWGLTHALH